eukprot:221494-Amphidinium_carterae.2
MSRTAQGTKNKCDKVHTCYASFMAHPTCTCKGAGQRAHFAAVSSHPNSWYRRMQTNSCKE